MNEKNGNQTIEKLTYTVEDISKILGISLRSAYDLCSETEEFKVKKIGRLIRIQKESFDKWFSEF